MKAFNERVFKNWKTSLLGLVLLIVAIIALFTGAMDAGSFMLMLPTILFLFRVKDTFLGNIGKGPGTTGIILLVIALQFSSCISYEKCIDKYGAQDSTIVTKIVKIPVYIALPADSNQTALNIDSVRSFIYGQIYTYLDSSSKIKIQYWYDKYTNLLHIKASTPPDTAWDTVIQIVEVEVPVFAPIPELTKWQKFIIWYQRTSGYLFPFLFIFICLFIWLILKKK